MIIFGKLILYIIKVSIQKELWCHVTKYEYLILFSAYRHGILLDILFDILKCFSTT